MIIIILEWVPSIQELYKKILYESILLKFFGRNIYICKFCNQRRTERVNRLKHHLARTHHGMKPCNKVSENARLECKEVLTNYKDQK